MHRDAHDPPPTREQARPRVVVLTADADFEQTGASDLRREPADRSAAASGDRGGRRRPDRSSTAPPSIVIDLDATRDDEMQALERLMTRTGGWPPVVVDHPGFRRQCRAHADADAGRGFPGEAGPPVELVRTCARVAKPGDRRKRRSRDLRRSCPPSAAPASPRSRSRPRCCCFERAARTRLDLPGRSQFPARRLRRLSRSRAAARSQRNRAASGSPRQATAGGDDRRITPRALR